ncbi:MAG: DUF4382 domain-containing protein [Candidatus Saccharicenans sp.]
MKKAVLVLTLFLAFFHFGCSSKPQSNFELYLTDAPAPVLQHVYVTLEAVYLRSEDRQSWTDNLLTEPKTIDLLKLRGREEKLAALNLPPGEYSGIKLAVSKIEIVTLERTMSITLEPPYVVTIPCHFTITAQGTTQVTLDFDAEKSFPWDGARYNFSPFIIVKKILHTS